METYKDVRSKLNEKLDQKNVSSRSGGNGVSFDYVSSHYVISRLNEILGQGNWSYETRDLILVHSGVLESNYQKKYTIHYIAHVILSGRIGDTPFSFGDYGYGDGTDKFSPGKAHELAVKEAVTDGLKRCAKNLGPSLGLALYDKEQKDVTEAAETTSQNAEVAKLLRKISTNSLETKPNVHAATPVSSDVKAKIKEAARQLASEGKITLNDFKAEFLGDKKLEDINDTEAGVIFIRVGFKYPHLKQLQ